MFSSNKMIYLFIIYILTYCICAICIISCTKRIRIHPEEALEENTEEAQETDPPPAGHHV
jgi:hypothetical protein